MPTMSYFLGLLPTPARTSDPSLKTIGWFYTYIYILYGIHIQNDALTFCRTHYPYVILHTHPHIIIFFCVLMHIYPSRRFPGPPFAVILPSLRSYVTCTIPQPTTNTRPTPLLSPTSYLPCSMSELSPFVVICLSHLFPPYIDPLLFLLNLPDDKLRRKYQIPFRFGSANFTHSISFEPSLSKLCGSVLMEGY